MLPCLSRPSLPFGARARWRARAGEAPATSGVIAMHAAMRASAGASRPNSVRTPEAGDVADQATSEPQLPPPTHAGPDSRIPAFAARPRAIGARDSVDRRRAERGPKGPVTPTIRRTRAASSAVREPPTRGGSNSGATRSRRAAVNPRALVPLLLRLGSRVCDADRRRDPSPVHRPIADGSAPTPCKDLRDRFKKPKRGAMLIETNPMRRASPLRLERVRAARSGREGAAPCNVGGDTTSVRSVRCKVG